MKCVCIPSALAKGQQGEGHGGGGPALTSREGARAGTADADIRVGRSGFSSLALPFCRDSASTAGSPGLSFSTCSWCESWGRCQACGGCPPYEFWAAERGET